MTVATNRVIAGVRPAALGRRLVTIARWPIMADVFFVVALLATAAIRWVILTMSAYPPGIDPGNWLAFGHAIAGEHIRSSSIVYPPVVPLLALVASRLFGPFLGIQLLAIISSLVPAIGAYFVLRRLTGVWQAAILSNFLALASSSTEAMSWGGYPQLIGLGFLLVYLWSFDRFLRSKRPIDALIAGLLLGLTLATSDIIGAAAVVTGALLLLGHIIIRPVGGLEIPKLIVGLGLVLIPCLPLVPIYVQLAGSVLQSFHTRPASAVLRTADLPLAVADLYPDFQFFWRTAILLTAALPFALFSLRRSPLWLLSNSLLFGTAVFVVALREPRFLFLLPPTAILGLACWFEFFRLSAARPMRRVSLVGCVALLLTLPLQAAAGAQYLRGNLLPYYSFINSGLVTAIDWIRDQTPADALVAVSPNRNDYPLGWWMEGLGRRKTLYASDPRWLNFADERRRAAEAGQIFNGMAPYDLSLARARRLGVSYLLVDKRWLGPTMWSDRGSSSGQARVILEDKSVLLLAIR